VIDQDAIITLASTDVHFVNTLDELASMMTPMTSFTVDAFTMPTAITL
jgi:hypothetical protein